MTSVPTTMAVLSKEDTQRSSSLTPDLEDGTKVEHTISRGTLGGEVGTVQAVSREGELFLIPTPSDDANDPLNWPRPYKWFVTVIACLQVFVGILTAAGPAIALIQMVQAYRTDIQTTSYLFTVYALLMGFGLLIWAPLIAKFGPRFSYVVSSILVFAFSIWQAKATTYGSVMAARVLSALSVAASEGLAPVTIADIWFLHERGVPMGIYAGALAVGTAIGSITCGAIVQHTDSFHNAYWFITALAGFTCFWVCFFFPDTKFQREAMPMKHAKTERFIDSSKRFSLFSRQSLRIWKGSQTDESFFKLLIRPIGCFALPSVFWAALVYAGTVGFMVALSTNFAPSFMPPPYLFSVQDIGFIGFAGLVGVLVATVLGGPATDFIANRLTRRNNGLREPEMRIPSVIVPLIFCPLGLVLYGAGIQNGWHWIVPIIGNGFVTFAGVWATAIAFGYVVDCYKPIAAEAVSGMMALKSAFGFVISFYTNTWVAEQGHLDAFGEMAGISAFCLGLGLVFYVFGKQWRHKANDSRLLAFLKWDDDRDDLVLADD